MKTLTIIYLAATAIIYARVGCECYFTRHTKKAGMVGLIAAATGVVLIAWVGVNA